MALLNHPDRVRENDKEVARERFAIIHYAYRILSDPLQREQYNNGSGVLFVNATKSVEWEHFLRPSTDCEIKDARMRYQNSIKEQNDIEKEFIDGKGSMTHLLNTIPFMRIEDEPRIIEMIKKSINEKKIPALKIKKVARK